jgi:dipeptidyl aminopeptidase/acylaminoacyl peptidase
MSFKKRVSACLVSIFILCATVPGAFAQKRFTIEQVLSPAYPFELVSARKADRIAWIAYERGMRNVYTAVAPGFNPARLTANIEDDGNDLSSLSISDDGSVVVFIRGHMRNREGWVANPSSNPQGAERAVWAARTTGGRPWKVSEADNASLSPDGQWVLYTREGQIYRAAVGQPRALSRSDTEKPLFRAFGNNGSPRWSPDGGRIAFVSNRNDHSFVGIYDIAKRKVTYLSPSVDRDTSPTWSPDGKRVAFIRRPGSPFGVQIQQSVGGPGGGGRFPPQGRQEGTGEGGQNQPPAVKGLTQATFKDGYTISFWAGDATTGEAREFWHNAPDDKLFTTINNIEWAGGNVIFSSEPEKWIRYYSVPLSGGRAEPITLTPGEGMAEQIALSRDGQHLFYSTNAGDIDRRHIWKVPTSGGTAVQLTSGDGIETYPAALASGNRVALLSATARQPQSVALLSTGGGKPQVIFPDFKGFPTDDQVVPENVVLTAEDGLKFHNQLFLPRGIKSGERRPAMIFVHGGPQRQMLLGYHYRHFYHMAYAINQYLANQGYVVLSVNYRSGIGYGKEFRNAQKRGQRGNSEYQDVLAAGKYLQGRPDIDPKRVGIWGLSYGGILTAQALARNSDVFAAGVDIAGVHLWGGSIDPKTVSYQSSSISQIEKWKSPVLLIHGDDDRNVAFSQTTGLVQLLRAHGVYHELIVFPDEVHDFLVHGKWLITFNALDDFFTRFLKNNGI